MAAPGRASVLSLYRNLLREAAQFPAYNFRMYGLRRTRDGFRLNKGLTEAASVQRAFDEGQQFLNVIKRQAVVYQLFKTKNLVIENS